MPSPKFQLTLLTVAPDKLGITVNWTGEPALPRLVEVARPTVTFSGRDRPYIIPTTAARAATIIMTIITIVTVLVIARCLSELIVEIRNRARCQSVVI